MDVSPLETAILKGVLGSFLVDVNYVNAPVIAKNKGLDVTTSKSQKSCDYIGSIAVKLCTDKGENVVSGALIAQGLPRIVKINEYNTSIEPEKHMMLVPHENKPSMIAKVAAVLGDSGINISRMNVAQKSSKHDNVSLMIINIESEVAPETLEKIAKIDGVCSARYINLTAINLLRPQKA